MSRTHLQRAAYHLSLPGSLAERHPGDPAAALAELRAITQGEPLASLRGIDMRLELTDEEAGLIAVGDVAALYRRGVHPNVVRNFAGVFGIDYVAAYREAGLRDD
ncbi:hypothetical protein Q5424_21355 [Conexibacter sp. JD483]|uniref:hypothetical protein n=1 Tax=unclassified Conexibacter TaxID=2627773 RepID=UPI00271AD09D|nr:MULTISPECIES: hypothetical protein [unclassified Conexibacter]MDO8188702.1 hypothetical protein [Conexibacter sp. CPCC 205706]MDO8201568.1 hypothetical protein [Conexibacter sp. CPCC 205762]MDR9371659.1 hypothetical protein [Conexibacter sp. JD483]